MGGGASIEIRHTHQSFVHVTDVHFQELLSSKAARETLFMDIVKYPLDGKPERNQMITLTKLAAYFTDNKNSLYPGFHVNVDTLNAAFKYTIEKFKEKQCAKKNKPLNKAKSVLQMEPKLTKPMVHSFLPTLLLFMRVWDIFNAADKLVVEDQKVFKGEFMRIKEKLNNVHGIVIFGETSDEEWEKEFDALDRNNDRYINFEEMCNYAIDHIKKPFDYNPAEEEALLLEGDDEDEENYAEDHNTFVEVVSHNVTKLGSKSTEEQACAAEAQTADAEPEKQTKSEGSPKKEELHEGPQAEASAEPTASAITTTTGAETEATELTGPPPGPVMFV